MAGPSALGTGGLLRVVSNSQLDAQQAERAKLAEDGQAEAPPQDLGSYIRRQWTIFRNHRNTGNDPLNQRLLRAQRMFEGKYDPDKLHEITKFGGSQVYSRIVAQKTRGASSLLRDIYLGADRPWDIQPQVDPPVPPEVQAHILSLVSSEVQTQAQAGQPVPEDQAHQRMMSLMHAAQQAARRNAMMQAKECGDKIEDLLRAGRFYTAMSEFLVDLPLFPFACLKGPVVRMVSRLTWNGNVPSLQMKPVMFWERVSPFDIYWTPGVSRIEDADCIERKRYTRADLNAMIGVPGFDETAIRGALADYSRGLREWLDAVDTEQALNEGRESPNFNQSQMIDGLEFQGNIQGRVLMEQGMTAAQGITDPDRDYNVQSWVVGRYTVKTQINPSPRQRHNYFVTSFEKVPGTVHGHGLADILEDIQEMANACQRTLVNNMAISSGPQVVINTDMIAPGEDSDTLYPWKRWKIQGDPMGSQREPITFFQPQSNAQELQQVYAQLSSMADDASAIPKYVTGESLSGGAGRTASGLSMLMNNAQKILQTVAANVDEDVMEPALSGLYDMIMLTDQSGILTGQEQIQVRGVNVAMQQETQRQKQLQFLQITSNPQDGALIGELGRGRLLRAIGSSMGLPDDIVPDDMTIEAQMQAQQQAAAMAQQAAAAQGISPAATAPGGGPGPGAPTQPKPGAHPPPGGPPGAPQGALQGGMQAPRPTPARHADHAPPVNSFQQQPMR